MPLAFQTNTISLRRPWGLVLLATACDPGPIALPERPDARATPDRQLAPKTTSPQHLPDARASRDANPKDARSPATPAPDAGSFSPCTPGARRCNPRLPSIAEACSKEHLWEPTAPCEGQRPVCFNGVCTECLPGEERCADPELFSCNALGTWMLTTICGGSAHCWPETTQCQGCRNHDDCQSLSGGSEAPLCNSATGECQQCLTHSDCPSAERAQCAPNTHQCVPCTSNTHCTESEAPLCNSATGECQQCLTHSDCPSAERAQCDPDTHQCVPCTSNAHCTEAGARVCQLESARCVECTATQSEGCAGAVCDTRPGVSQFTCSQLDPGSSNKCRDCVSDAQCLQGQKCVPTSFQGVSTGHQCFWLEGSPGAPALCDAIVAPYVERTSTTSLDGTSGVYCQLATTTCAAHLQWRATGCDSDDECGAPGASDGLCRSWNDALTCTYPCVSDADCPFTCDTMVGECLLDPP